MIRFDSVGMNFGEVVALDSLSFELGRGAVVGLLGRNGAGKTTSMRLMTGYLAPSRGAVYFDGRPFGPAAVEMKERIGYLPESAPHYPDMLAWDVLQWQAAIHGSRAQQRVDAVIDQTGLAEQVHKTVRTLSKGYRQRLGLAHALLHDPEFVVLDEPTSGLDPNQIVEVRALIRTIAKDKTVILSTHIMQEIEALCDRVIMIHDGTLRFDGDIAQFASLAGSAGTAQRVQVLAKADSERAISMAFAGLPAGVSIDRHDRLFRLELTANDQEDLRPLAFAAAVQAGITIYEMRAHQGSFEDVFHQLTQEQYDVQ